MSKMRHRSPSYPYLGLEKAEKLLKSVRDAIGDNTVPRERALEALGYASAKTSAATSSLAALTQYGLLERNRKEYKVSGRGKSLLHPIDGSKERLNALRDAFAEPKIYAELRGEISQGRIDVNGDSAYNWLVRKGFGEQGAKKALTIYRQTEEFIREVATEAGEIQHSGGGEEAMMGDKPDQAEEELAPPIQPTRRDDVEREATGTRDQSPRPSHSDPSPVARETQTDGEAAPLPPPSGQSALQTAIADIKENQFRTSESISGELRVDVVACQLDINALKRLIRWLEAIKNFADGDDATAGAQKLLPGFQQKP